MAKTLFLLLVDERGKVDDSLAVQLQLPRAGYEILWFSRRSWTPVSPREWWHRDRTQGQARTFNQFDDLLALSKTGARKDPIHCLFVDEAQFLTRQQVSNSAMSAIFSRYGSGLRSTTDFQGNLFEGACNCWPGQTHWSKSRRFAIVDEKPPCSSNRRKRAAIKEGSQVQIGGKRTLYVCLQDPF